MHPIDRNSDLYLLATIHEASQLLEEAKTYQNNKDLIKAREYYQKVIDSGIYTFVAYARYEKVLILLFNAHISTEDFLEALNLSNDIISDFSSPDGMRDTVLFNKGLLLQRGCGDTFPQNHPAALEIFSHIIEDPDVNHKTKIMAKFQKARILHQGMGVSKNLKEALLLYNEISLDSETPEQEMLLAKYFEAGCIIEVIHTHSISFYSRRKDKLSLLYYANGLCMQIINHPNVANYKGLLEDSEYLRDQIWKIFLPPYTPPLLRP